MIKCKKIFLKLFTIMMVLTFFVIPNFTEVNGYNIKNDIQKIETEADNNDNNEAVEKTRTVMGIIISVIQVIGTGVAVIMLTVLGIKYVSSAPEGKAEIKKTMVPYVVGAIIIFASSQLLAIIADIGEGLANPTVK